MRVVMSGERHIHQGERADAGAGVVRAGRRRQRAGESSDGDEPDGGEGVRREVKGH